MKCGFLNNDNPTVNLAFCGCFNPTHKNGDDLGMVYYWLYNITRFCLYRGGYYTTGLLRIKISHNMNMFVDYQALLTQ